MKPDEFNERKYDTLRRAANRWEQNIEKVADATRKLAEGGPAVAASPEQVTRFRKRETMRTLQPSAEIGWERVIGATIDLDDNAPTDLARMAGQPVARIVELFDNNSIGEGFATGFIIGPNLLMTNWHVFAGPSEALGCGAQLGYERNEQGLINSGVVFEMDPDTFFLSNKELDIALVSLKRTPAIGSDSLENFRHVQLIPSLGKILVGHRVSIIQHPDGRHKHWAVRQNQLLFEPNESDLFLTYSTDTMPGSSGSPAFNNSWELVAVHHSGVPRMVNGEILTRDQKIWNSTMPDSAIDWIGNEGARVSHVYAWLKEASLADAHQQTTIDALLEAVLKRG